MFHETSGDFLDADFLNSDGGVLGFDKGDCIDNGLYIGIDFFAERGLSPLPSVAISHDVEEVP